MRQVVPKLEGVDELLNIPLDEECLQRLLSGDCLDDDGPVVRAVLHARAKGTTGQNRHMQRRKSRPSR